jgi:hypothetical protein
VKIPGGGRQDPVRLLPIKATRLIAICGRCGRKIGGGFGPRGDKALSKSLRRVVEGAKGKRATVRIVETRCLDICPKRAVALIDSHRPGQVMIVAAGTPVETVADRVRIADQVSVGSTAIRSSAP